MKFGRNMKVEIKEVGNLIEIRVTGVKKGIRITPTDFGIDLHRRKMEGVTPDPREEIDVICGIEDEITTGEDIIFEYLYGDKLSGVILAGTVAKKHLDFKVKAIAMEIGGINTVEQNKDYITIAIQKMLGTNDSIGGVVECILPYTLDLTPIKGETSKAIFDLMKEVTAIQFANGITDSKANAKEYELKQNRILITFGPHQQKNKKIPCLACVRDVVVEAIIAINLL